MYKNQEDVKEYFRQHYKNHKDEYKTNIHNYWYRKAKVKFGVEEPTEEQIRETRNEYYRNYRKDHPVETKNTVEKFYKNWAENNKEE